MLRVSRQVCQVLGIRLSSQAIVVDMAASSDDTALTRGSIPKAKEMVTDRCKVILVAGTAYGMPQNHYFRV